VPRVFFLAFALCLGLSNAVAAQESGDLCAKIAASFRKIASGPEAVAEKNFYPESPLSMLGDNADSGVSLASHIAEAGTAQRPLDWARAESIVLSPDLQGALDRADFLDRLPDTNFFAATRIEGTAYCYDSTTFQVNDNQAQLVSAPPNWDQDEGSGCGITRMFGKVEAASVAFQENYDYSPALNSALSASAWTDGHFASACTVDFSFAPRFSARDAYNEWEQSCSADNCDELRQLALALVEAVQADPIVARKAQFEKLNDSQRSDFDALEKLAAAKDPDKIGDPADLTDQSPLPVPLLVGDTLYLARVGHWTIGWRTYSDWSVKLDERQGDQLKPVANIAIGMAKGKLENASVK
jgi:hypothetical protein